MKRVTPALLLLALLGACDDGPAAPETVDDVEILQNSVPAGDQSLVVGETAQLSASLTDESGRTMQGRRPSWRSEDESIATVDTSGLVTARRVGTTRIIAKADLVADTIRVTVRNPVTVPSDIACAPGQAPRALAVGEVLTTSAQETPLICLGGGAAGSEYVLIPFNASAASERLAVEVAGGGLTEAAGPPTPARLPAGAGALLLNQYAGMTLQEDWAFHRRLREMGRQYFPAIRDSGRNRPFFSRSAAAVPAVGDTIRLNASTSEKCAGTRRLARVEAVTQRALVVSDTLNPSGGFSREEFREFGLAFDTLVYPVITRNFGEPSDIDDNDRVIIFYSKAVNDLTEAGSGSYVGGFFHPLDLVEVAQCAGSNFAEILYMLAPDTTRGRTEGAFQKESVAEETVGVIAHELQHLVNASRRAFIHNADDDEVVWMNEGLSHIAEELLYFAQTPHEPKQNIGIAQLRGNQTIFDAFIRYQSSNMFRFISYLETPEEQSLIGQGNDDDLETRGAAWAFLRYAADRKADAAGQRDVWFNLVNTNQRGVPNLNRVLGVNAIDWMQDWTVSVYADDAGFPVDARYTQPSWNWRSIAGPGGLRRASDGRDFFPVFPLKTIRLSNGVDNDVNLLLQGGGAAFLRFGILPNGSAAVRTTSAGTVAPQRLRVSIVRTK